MAIQEEDILKILNGNVDILVEKAKNLGEELAIRRELRVSQLRNVYGIVRHAHMEWEKDPQSAYNTLILLQPKLAYFTNRTKGKMMPLKEALDKAIQILRQDKEPHETHFKNFVDFCEAIVAYHRANRRETD